MQLFIKIKDNKPFEHPILGDNLTQAFPDIDLQNLPSDYAIFERVDPPVIGPYDKNLRNEYQIGEDNIVRDVWLFDAMSEEEKLQKQQETRDSFIEATGFVSWTLDEETCTMKPPVPRILDGKNYVWRESDTTWVEVPPLPEGDKKYDFNLETGQWEETA